MDQCSWLEARSTYKATTRYDYLRRCLSVLLPATLKKSEPCKHVWRFWRLNSIKKLKQHNMFGDHFHHRISTCSYLPWKCLNSQECLEMWIVLFLGLKVQNARYHVPCLDSGDDPTTTRRMWLIICLSSRNLLLAVRMSVPLSSGRKHLKAISRCSGPCVEKLLMFKN